MKKLEYKLPPMEHQKKAMAYAWPHYNFAYFMEMGTGKTYAAINLAAARFINKQINALVVVCPTPIKLVWESEFEKFCPIDYDVFVMQSGMNAEAKKFAAKETDALKVFVVGIEALSQGKAGEIAAAFAKSHETMTVIDEASGIKSERRGRKKTARTWACYAIGEQSMYRLIMTGTPITQGVEDLYSQFRFLNQWIIGCKSYFQFKNLYCQIGGFENRQIVGYQNVTQLLEKVEPYVYAVRTDECIDMPEKSYRQLFVEPTDDQKRAMQSLKDLFEAEIEGDSLVTATILERLTRYQQIVGGNFPFNLEDGGFGTKPIPGPNPKLQALVEDIKTLGITEKVVIWARFRPEVDLVSKTLRSEFGDRSVVEFHGGVDYADRKNAIESFQDDSSGVRFFVSNQAVGGMGITLTAGRYTYYYSNDFSYQNRVQSEARTWRNGQHRKCIYTDIIMRVPYDTMIAKAITRKQDLAVFVDSEIETIKKGGKVSFTINN